MGRTWRKEERQSNKKKFRKGQYWDRQKRQIKEDEPRRNRKDEDSAEDNEK